MSQNRRVVWGEGLLLTPQHLQQAERSLRYELATRFRMAQAFEWGLTTLRVDRESLRNGRMALLEASGVLPDGTPFAMPGDDPLPAERDIGEHVDAHRTEAVVSLGLPLDHAGRRTVGPVGVPGAAGPRFTVEEIEIDDVTADQGRRPVEVTRTQASLLFADDAIGEYSALPIARILRSPEGGFALDENYIPPLLAIGASERLKLILKEWFQKLVGMSTDLGKGRAERGDVGSFASADAESFWLLHTVNSHLPAVAHVLEADHQRLHPEAAYRALVSLAGSFCTFSMKIHPKDLAVYRHQNLTETFSLLTDQLRELTARDPRRNALPVLLQPTGLSQWNGDIVSEQLMLPTTRFYLGVRTDVDDAKLIADLPTLARLASRERLPVILDYGLRGVPLLYERRPPATLPARAGFLYFQIETRGDEWESIRTARNLGVFLPPEYPSPTVEVWGVLA